MTIYEVEMFKENKDAPATGFPCMAFRCVANSEQAVLKLFTRRFSSRYTLKRVTSYTESNENTAYQFR